MFLSRFILSVFSPALFPLLLSFILFIHSSFTHFSAYGVSAVFWSHSQVREMQPRARPMQMLLGLSEADLRGQGRLPGGGGI